MSGYASRSPSTTARARPRGRRGRPRGGARLTPAPVPSSMPSARCRRWANRIPSTTAAWASAGVRRGAASHPSSQRLRALHGRRPPRRRGRRRRRCGRSRAPAAPGRRGDQARHALRDRRWAGSRASSRAPAPAARPARHVGRDDRGVRRRSPWTSYRTNRNPSASSSATTISRRGGTSSAPGSTRWAPPATKQRRDREAHLIEQVCLRELRKHPGAALAQHASCTPRRANSASSSSCATWPVPATTSAPAARAAARAGGGCVGRRGHDRRHLGLGEQRAVPVEVERARDRRRSAHRRFCPRAGGPSPTPGPGRIGP